MQYHYFYGSIYKEVKTTYQKFKEEKPMEKIIKNYNRLMESLCLEYLTIDTIYSEGTDG